nr:MAG TPA: hypothetical protein [Caudoviricetes sp.]DAZ51393.1 MAG TPA: hypothetical protein [Caudoviricetes sp.]
MSALSQPIRNDVVTPIALAIFSSRSIGIFSVCPVAYRCKADFGIPVLSDKSP